ncbi:hypothetical protein [Prauserella sp. PE36]|uniref:hypothetical protein n=1 Tax=Prauserella sp. PE36 TaxID=1504709 RepID=UPI0011BDFFCF|nr:hypothetical protein [Prauserella sp. PE36]
MKQTMEGNLMIVHARRWSQRLGTASFLLAPILVMGCSGTEESRPQAPSPEMSAPQASTPFSSAPNQRQAVEQAYIQFWPLSLQVAQRPEENWRDAMSAVAVDPQLSITLSSMRQQKAAGITTYGEVTVRITSVVVTGDSAKVVDCQDGSRAGQADAATGDKKTVGVARMPVHATLVRDASGGQWKVSKIDFPGGAC